MNDFYDGGASAYDLHDNLENFHVDFDDFFGSKAL
jgi:hypothetical protein